MLAAGYAEQRKVLGAEVFRGQLERADNDQNEMKESVCSSF